MGRINYQADGENFVTQLIDRGEKARSHQALCGSTGLHLHGLARPSRSEPSNYKLPFRFASQAT